MGIAIDTVVFKATNPGASATAAAAVSGDSLTVRSFDKPAYARLEQLWRQGATAGLIGIRSPVLHDPTRGIRFTTAETPSIMDMPRDVGQPLAPSDTLIAELSGGTAEVDLGAMMIYYSDVTGLSANLFNWGDIRGAIGNIKPLEVDITTNGTAGLWSEAAFNSTEDLFHADRQYAVLGYLTDTAVLAVALRGAETGNIRAGGPGTTASFDTTDYFIRMSERMGTPHIPVIKANNRAAIMGAISAVATSTAVKVQYILAEMADSWGG